MDHPGPATEWVFCAVRILKYARAASPPTNFLDEYYYMISFVLVCDSIIFNFVVLRALLLYKRSRDVPLNIEILVLIQGRYFLF